MAQTIIITIHKKPVSKPKEQPYDTLVNAFRDAHL